MLKKATENTFLLRKKNPKELIMYYLEIVRKMPKLSGRINSSDYLIYVYWDFYE